MNKISKQLSVAHQFAPYKQVKTKIKGWRKSWLHQRFIQSSKPNVLSIAHALMLDKALSQKQAFQDASESIRFDFFELWQDMDYSQRNAFLQQYLQPMYENLVSFKFEDENIVIPFFNPLLNALIMKRPAVFDLDQYYRLYKEFKDNTIDPLTTYGQALLLSDFYEFKLCLSYDDVLIVYDARYRAMLVLKQYQLKEVYSLFSDINDDNVLMLLAHDIMNQDMLGFVKHGCEHNLFHPKLIKMWQRKLQKKEKGAKL